VARSLPGLPVDGDRIITSREALELRDLPGSVVIVGGGPVGVEFAYFWRSYGVKVTVVELVEHLLPNEDEEVGRALARAFAAKGIDVLTGEGVEAVEANEGGVRVRLKGKPEALAAERVLVAVGFGPNSEGLGLQEAGVELEHGFVRV